MLVIGVDVQLCKFVMGGDGHGDGCWKLLADIHNFVELLEDKLASLFFVHFSGIFGLFTMSL
jgi:hypothetical protein